MLPRKAASSASNHSQEPAGRGVQPEEREAFRHFPPRSVHHLVAQRDVLLNYAAVNPVGAGSCLPTCRARVLAKQRAVWAGKSYTQASNVTPFGCLAGLRPSWAVPVLRTDADVCHPWHAHFKHLVWGAVWREAWLAIGSR